jgi:GNAT superfamily N-acetyltransferase
VTVLHGTTDLYERGAATLLGSWAAFARGSADAALRRDPGVASAVFPRGPERSILNNALFERDLPRGARRAAIEAMEAAYAQAGVERFAAWVHERDAPLRAELEARGYALQEATRMMGMGLDEIRVGRPRIADLSRDWRAHLDYLAGEGVERGFLAGVEPDPFHVVNAGPRATGIAFSCDGDCGIYNVGTRPDARRQGLGTAVTALLVREAADRGCVTASLQSTAVAERVYASVGFRDLGLILEYGYQSVSKSSS